jgi:hypothetical protein
MSEILEYFETTVTNKNYIHKTLLLYLILEALLSINFMVFSSLVSYSVHENLNIGLQVFNLTCF